MRLVMEVSSLTHLDIVMLLVLLFSGYVLISEKGLKKGGLYLFVLLFFGAVISFISSYSDVIGKYLLILLILILGLAWNYKKSP